MYALFTNKIEVLIGTPSLVKVVTTLSASLFRPSFAAKRSLALSVIAVIKAEIMY